jgi:Domain of unknown function (DUF4272)
MISDSSIGRKHRSEAILQKEGVPFISHLPVIEDEAATQICSLESIAWRAMALSVVAVKAEGLEHERILEIIEQYKLEDTFTPKERMFVFDEVPSHHDCVQFIWRYESYWVLLWALSYVGELSRPDKICDVPRAVSLMVDRSPEEFIRDAQIRSKSEILDAADLIFRYHWACVDARLNGGTIPEGLDCSVVFERHYALNWLIGYVGEDEWDDVPTNT